MKDSLPFKIYGLILMIIFGGIVLHAPFIVGFGTFFPDYELLFKSWKEILILIAIGLAAWIVWRSGRARELYTDKILHVTALYVSLHLLISSALITGPLATVAGLMIDLRYILFFVLVYVCVKFAPDYRRQFILVGAAGAAIVVGFGFMQLFLPADILAVIGYGESTIQPYMTVDKNPDYIRINSTLRGPNPLGAYVVIIIGLLTSLYVRRRVYFKKTKTVLLIACAAILSLIVLWMSYSRSAAAAAVAAVSIIVGTGARHLISRPVWIVLFILATSFLGIAITAREHSFVENVVLHENDEGGSEISSNDDHVASLQDGTNRMFRQPFGAGVGSTGSASLFSDEPLVIENQYLFIAHEVGWLGLGLFMLLIGMLMLRLWCSRQDWLALGVFSSGVGLSLIGILLPVWADDTVSIIWWGFAAVAIASGGQHVSTTTKQKTKRSI